MKMEIETIVAAPIETVWAAWSSPDDVMRWNAASDDWHTTSSTVELFVGGRFCHRMEAKDGSMGFDFEGIYKVIVPHQRLEYELEDGRKVVVVFEETGDDGVRVRESFDPDPSVDAEAQKAGWQAILDRFKTHVERKQLDPGSF